MHRKWFLLIGGLVIFWYCVVRQLIDWVWVASPDCAPCLRKMSLTHYLNGAFPNV